MLKTRFGRKIKLPSTAAIKHQIMTLMLADLLKAEARDAAAPKGRVSPRGEGIPEPGRNNEQLM